MGMFAHVMLKEGNVQLYINPDKIVMIEEDGKSIPAVPGSGNRAQPAGTKVTMEGGKVMVLMEPIGFFDRI